MLGALAARYRTDEVLTAVKHIPAREAQFRPMPDWVRPELAAAYRAKGIDQLYSHQAAAAELARSGKNFVVVTPTASGKTLCYNLPVLNAVLENPDTRALYLFPTKALAQDQLAELHDLAKRLDDRFGVFTYDGDTPSDARKAIRERGHIVLTNPDMLHTGILPHHTRGRGCSKICATSCSTNCTPIAAFSAAIWRTCCGGCGASRDSTARSRNSSAARRRSRIPANWRAQLIEENVEVIEENGAPAGEKVLRLLQPAGGQPLSGHPAQLYRTKPRASRKEFLKRKLQTIVFANSRLHTEVLLTYLQQANPPQPGPAEPIRGYRGGYLPGERREIERGLREGRIRGVVSTNALELGIDVGSLDAVRDGGLCRHRSPPPGSAPAARDAAAERSCAVLVASSAPLDQFIVQHPDYFFGRSPEHAFVQPDNLEILVNHLKCAAFELPLSPDEKFGDVDLPDALRAAGRSGLSASQRRQLALDAGSLSGGHREPARRSPPTIS